MSVAGLNREDRVSRVSRVLAALCCSPCLCEPDTRGGFVRGAEVSDELGYNLALIIWGGLRRLAQATQQPNLRLVRRGGLFRRRLG